MKAKQSKHQPPPKSSNTNNISTASPSNYRPITHMECKDNIPPLKYAAIDTSQPFASVKEAVAIFGERIPLKEARNSPKLRDGRGSFGMTSPGKSPREDGERGGLEHALKKLEAELSQAKEELRHLKKKETETEVAVAALNAELHRSMSRLAKAEADAASRRLMGLEKGKEERAANEGRTEISPYSPTLAQVLAENLQEGEECNGASVTRNDKRMMMTLTKKQRQKQKQKPIVPLVWEFFSWRKTSADDIHKSYFSSPRLLN